jgi:hypothetical protein
MLLKQEDSFCGVWNWYLGESVCFRAPAGLLQWSTSGYHACHWTQGSQVETWLRKVDF